MNPDLSRVALRPRGALEVMDLAMVLIWRHSHAFRRLARGWLGVPLLATVILAVATQGHLTTWIPVLFVWPILTLPFSLLAARSLFADEVQPKLWRADLRVGALLKVMALEWALSVVILCTGLLGVFVAIGLAFWMESYLLERVSLGRAIRRSLQLAGGAPLAATSHAIVARFLLPMWGALVGEVTAVGAWQMFVQSGTVPFAAAEAFGSPWMAAGALATVPLAGVYRFLLYVDARTRAEAWDLQVDLRAAGMPK